MDDDIDWWYLNHDTEAALPAFCDFPTAGRATPRSSDAVSGVFSFNPSESGDAQQPSQLGTKTPDYEAASLQSHLAPQPQSSQPPFQHSTADSASFEVSAEPLSNWEYSGDNDFDFMLSQGPSHAPSHEQDSTEGYDLGGWSATPHSTSRRSLASASSSRDAGRILTPNSSSDGTSSAPTDFAKASNFNNASHQVNAPQVRHHAKTIAPKPRSYPVRVDQTVTVRGFTPLRGATSPELPPQQINLCEKQWVVPSLGKRKRSDAAAQRKTRRVRAVGACIRCRMLNLKVRHYLSSKSAIECETYRSSSVTSTCHVGIVVRPRPRCNGPLVIGPDSAPLSPFGLAMLVLAFHTTTP